MKTELTDEQLIDYLSNAFTPETNAAIELELSVNEPLRDRLDELRNLKELVENRPDEQLSARGEARFADFLAKATEQSSIKSGRTRLITAGNWYRLVAVAASILLVFSVGWHFGQRGSQSIERELLANRSLMMELMQGKTTSQRIQATRVALKATTPDHQLIDNLGYLLLNDESTNVQLAALSALQRYADEPLVRETLLKAISSERPEIVHLQLIEILVGLSEKRVLPYLQELLDNKSLPQHLKDAAQMGKFKLI